MKKQIRRLAPHQNGKVLGVLMAVGTLPVIVLTTLPMMLLVPKVDLAGNPIDLGFEFFSLAMCFFMPIIYLVFTYLSVAFSCWLYNKFFKFIGGFEFELRDDELSS